MLAGLEKGWEILSALEPDEVCLRAGARFDRASGLYTLKSFAWDISVSPAEKRMFSNSSEGGELLKRLGYFSQLSILWYLVNAKDIPLSNVNVKPENLKGGQLFFRGTHVLPLDKVAEKYGADAEGFLKKVFELGGMQDRFGDASVKLYPLPRVPVLLILWKNDEEFPARFDLLFDRSCDIQLPMDIIWSVAMMSVMLLL